MRAVRGSWILLAGLAACGGNSGGAAPTGDAGDVSGGDPATVGDAGAGGGECIDGHVQACGLNGRGRRSCADGSWSDCDDPDACEDGDFTSRACGADGTGTQEQVCENGQWVDEGACRCDGGEERQETCGLNERGTVSFVCIQGAWVPGECDDPDVCKDGDVGTLPCGLDNSGTLEAHCEWGVWTQWDDNCSQVCGNGTLEGAEACDDGGSYDGDGCSALCALEPLRWMRQYGDTCDAGPQLSLAPDGSAHVLRSCRGDSSLLREVPAQAPVFTAWKTGWSQWAPDHLGFSQASAGSPVTLWGDYLVGMPWSLFPPDESGGFILELDEQHHVTTQLLVDGGNRPKIEHLTSFGSGDFALSGDFNHGGYVRFVDLKLTLPPASFVRQDSRFMLRQRGLERSGAMLQAAAEITSSEFAADPARMALLVGMEADAKLAVNGREYVARHLLLTQDAQATRSVAVRLGEGESRVILAANGYTLITGQGGGLYEALNGPTTISSGPVVLVYDRELTLVAALVGELVGQAANGNLAVTSTFQGSELILDAGLSTATVLRSPYGPYNRYLASYRQSGALASAQILASSTNDMGSALLLASSDGLADGFAIGLTCSISTQFGEGAESKVLASASKDSCVARFDADGKLAWAHSLTVGLEWVRLRLDGDDTWWSGPFTFVDGEPYGGFAWLVRANAMGEINVAESVVAAEDGRVRNFVVSQGHVLIDAVVESYATLFPERTWSRRVDYSSYGEDVVLAFEP